MTTLYDQYGRPVDRGLLKVERAAPTMTGIRNIYWQRREAFGGEAASKGAQSRQAANGYAAPQRHELTGKDGSPLTLVQLLDAVGPIEEDGDETRQ